MCGGFTCSKNALTALNILYMLVAFILIGVAVYGRASTTGVNLPIIGGILACGVFLIIISVLGLVGAIKHHQVLLFFYMLILFLLFLIQFSIACACLAVNLDQQHALANQAWNKMSNDTKLQLEQRFHCNGFDHGPLIDYVCKDIVDGECIYPDTCDVQLQYTINYAFKLSGGIGLFFSFTEVIAAVIAYRYRNQVKKTSSAIMKPYY